MIDIEKILEKKHPEFSDKPKIFRKILLFVLNKILMTKEINELLGRYSDEYGMQFIDEIFEHLNFSYRISNKDIKKIPSEGRLIIVANHPIGSLDALALMSAVYNVRQDIKIIANDILTIIENINEYLLPVALDSKAAQKDNIIAIGEELQNEKAVIMFPASEVSRLKFYRIVDGKWNKGAIHFAKKFNTPILPVYIKAKNSALFYLISALNKKVSTLLLVRELFNKKDKVINLKIGDNIPAKAFSSNYLNASIQSKLLKKHVYKINKHGEGIYNTEKNIIHPVDTKQLYKEIMNALILGRTRDNKRILLTDYANSPNVLKEIARLREITFRSVGEGSGKKMDIDKFDRYYNHIVLWDDAELEIIGAYRIGLGEKVFSEYGMQGFYVSTLFNFNDSFAATKINESIELGRSFVQKKYWNSNALDYLWLGIGAFLARNPDIKYLFGPVSISNIYPDEAKGMLVYFYNKWFGSINQFAESKNRFQVPEKKLKYFQQVFNENDYKKEFRILKQMMKGFGFTVPVLYKHYTDLCAAGGVEFLDFCIDPDFENCVDGLILVDVGKIKPEKKERYINWFDSVKV